MRANYTGSQSKHIVSRWQTRVTIPLSYFGHAELAGWAHSSYIEQNKNGSEKRTSKNGKILVQFISCNKRIPLKTCKILSFARDVCVIDENGTHLQEKRFRSVHACNLGSRTIFLSETDVKSSRLKEYARNRSVGGWTSKRVA